MGGAALVVFASVLSQFFVPHLGQDQNSYLFEAQRLLSGAEAYGPQLAETNPPMIIWFSAIPILIAHWVHASPEFLFKLLLVAMIMASVSWCIRLLRRNTAITNPVAIGLLGFAILAIEFNTEAIDFGQREHLLVILFFPYIIAAATGAVSRLSAAERCALGVAAGVAIWFKPQDTLVLVALELFILFRTRSLRRILAPEFLSLAATSSLILVLVRFLTPLYLKNIYPLLVDVYWGLGGANAFRLALRLRYYTPAVFITFLFCLLVRRRLRDPATSIAFLVCSVAGSIAYDIQHANWTYHTYPHMALLLLALSYLLVDLLYPAIVRLTASPVFVRRFMVAAAVASAVMLCAIAIHPRLAYFARKQPDSSPLNLFLTQFKPSTTVYIFSTSVTPMSDAYVHGLNWGSRFAHLWMMPAIIQNELGPVGPYVPFKRLSPQRLSELATLQRTETTEDLNYWHPSIVLVQHCSKQEPCQGLEGKNFDMIAWFQQSPEFAATWSHYQQQPGIPNFDVYKLTP